jgi:peptidoglycan/xylan/chitin deacetylase (PgdA/CDA1 family)
MGFFLIKTPRFISTCLSETLLWKVSHTRDIFLTFDDGPHPKATPWVLECLQKYGMQGTFFCVGRNVELHETLFHHILAEGHQVGNHTYSHLDAWKFDPTTYLKDVIKAEQILTISAGRPPLLFRPPYGHLKPKIRQILSQHYRIVMWDVLTGDFEPTLNVNATLKKVYKAIEPGSIIVFHDSEKAFPQLKKMLPLLLHFLKEEGYGTGFIPT